jgi:hypothetical protein
MSEKRKTRLYEPWGYQEENDYESSVTILDNELDKFFTTVVYDKDNKQLVFGNKEGESVGTLDVTDFVTDTVVEEAYYKDGKIIIKFTNGQIVEIDVKELIDETEFGDGLQVNSGRVSVLIDSISEPFINVSESGISISGVTEAIGTKVQEEAERAQTVEQEIKDKIDEFPGADELYDVINQHGYMDNDTLETSNEHEAAFGEYNISHISEEASGQTIFSIGNGTSDDNRSNAIEVMKNGDLYLWVEGEFMNINKLLGQIAHEVYDTDSTHNSHFFDGE